MQWGGIVLFLFAAIQGPLEVAGLRAGTLQYPLARFFVFVAVGKMLKITAFVLASYYSLAWLLGTN